MRKRWVLAVSALWPRAKAAPVVDPAPTSTTIATTTGTLPKAAAEV